MDNKDKRSFASTEVRTIDEKELTIDHIVNTKTLDRYNTYVLPKGAIVKNFLKNPVVLWLHNVDNNPVKIPIAKCIDIKITEDEIKVRTKFNANDPLAVKVFEAYRDGFLNAWSIGFQPLSYTQYDESNLKELNKKFNLKVTKKQLDAASYNGLYVIDTWELHEYSAVPVPANPEALNFEEKEKHCLALATRGLITETDFSKLDLVPEEKVEAKVTEEEIEEVAKEEEKVQEVVEETELEPKEEVKEEEVIEEQATETEEVNEEEEEDVTFIKEKKEVVPPTEDEVEAANNEAEKTELEKEREKNSDAVIEPEAAPKKKDDVEDLVITKEEVVKEEATVLEIPDDGVVTPKEEIKTEPKSEPVEEKPKPGEKVEVETLLDVLKIVTKKLEAMEEQMGKLMSMEKKMKKLEELVSVDNIDALRSVVSESTEEEVESKDFSIVNFLNSIYNK